MNRTATSLVASVAALLALPAAAQATTEPAPADDPAFCADYQGTLAQFFAEDGPDPELAAAGLAAMAESAPADIAGDVTVVVDGATAELGGDGEATSTPEFGIALSALDNWSFDNCTFDSKVDVTAVDWAFGGIPLEIPAGRAAFRVTNDGTEMHEMGILRRLDGVTESWDEIIPIVSQSFLEESDAAMEYVEWVGHAWIPSEGSSSVAYLDLSPGEYAAFCMLPVGTHHDMTDEEMESMVAGPDYAPHWEHGMLQEFTVVDAG
jgi:hypothetical protein